MTSMTSSIGWHSAFSKEVKMWTIISALSVADLQTFVLYFLTFLNRSIEFDKIVNVMQRGLENNHGIFSNKTFDHV